MSTPMGDRLEAQSLNKLDEALRELGTQAQNGTLSPSFKLKHPHSGEEVSLQDLFDGYLRQKDYTQKTQEIAEIKRMFGSTDEATKAVQELQQRRQFGENINAFFARRPDVYDDIQRFVDSNGEDAGKTAQPKSDDEPPKLSDDNDSTKVTDKKPDDKVQSFQLPDEVTQKLASIDKINDSLKGITDKISQMDVDKAISQLMEQENIKYRQELNPVIDRASKDYNPQKGYFDNLYDAYKIVKFEQDKENDRLRSEKENAYLFHGSESGTKKAKTDGEMILEGVKQTNKPLDIFSGK